MPVPEASENPCSMAPVRRGGLLCLFRALPALGGPWSPELRAALCLDLPHQGKETNRLEGLEVPSWKFAQRKDSQPNMLLTQPCSLGLWGEIVSADN